MYFYIICVEYDNKQMYLKGRFLVHEKGYASRYEHRRTAKRAFHNSEYANCNFKIVPYFVETHNVEARND